MLTSAPRQRNTSTILMRLLMPSGASKYSLARAALQWAAAWAAVGVHIDALLVEEPHAQRELGVPGRVLEGAADESLALS